MKQKGWIAGGILVLLALAAMAYFWATGLFASLEAYRSPLHASPPQAGPALGQPATRRVVFVLIDALRADTAQNAEVMPTLAKLRAQGASATDHSQPPSYSEPGYSVLLTGAWPELSDGPAVNLDYADIPTFTQDNLFSAAHRAGLQTAVSGYYWFEKLIPQSAVDLSFYTPGEDRVADRAVVDAALPWLAGDQAQLVLVHIDQVDYAGHHEGGAKSPAWNEAARRADDLLAEIVAQLDLSQDTLLVTSDHGQIDAGGHGGDDPVVLVEPFVLVGAGVKPGSYPDIQMVDIAPTLAALLGTNLPASTQGQVLTDMLDLPEQTLAALPAATQAQQTALLKAYSAGMGVAAPAVAGTDVAAYQAAIASIRADRIACERLPRIGLAVVLGLIPLVMLFLKRRSGTAWFLGGAILFQALFHFRYAFLDGKVYSLSGITSQADFTSYIVTTGGIALVISWTVIMLASGLLRRGPAAAARGTLALALTTAYLLLIPILYHFALNGAVVTGFLPEMAPAFMALLSLVALIIVSAGGLLLTGLAALLATRSQPENNRMEGSI
ncbi:uncharacterized protein of the AP superfamily [Longilinea arvoryzae]|uniref:Uncharacterized protein of the AP superfamily n=1 Tax=Longilinea arvoryzae TaxID=360412 RepID=A0A0S7BD68_9CHLR|nr:alkaline phosphatase family protein [Longilinea arvoryzae]GAP15855.1 uncharacterized protein of the AP superfamily [Longilinea arvoryzae]